MKTLVIIFHYIIDFFFPPSAETLKLRSLQVENLFVALPPATPPPYSFIISLFAYKHPLVSELIWSIKYKRDRHAIELGGFALYVKLQEKPTEKVILIPIPISKKRRKERGYNQCEFLVDEIIKLDRQGKFERRFDILIRTKHTSRQTLKNRQERLKSAESIFSVNKVPLNYPIIIIDDVSTTGSTLKEARDVLLQAGYADVTCLTLAH